MTRIRFVLNLVLAAGALWHIAALSALAAPTCHGDLPGDCPTSCTRSFGDSWPCCYEPVAFWCCRYTCTTVYCAGTGCPPEATPPKEVSTSGPTQGKVCATGGQFSGQCVDIY